MIRKSILAFAAAAALVTLGVSTGQAGDRYHRRHYSPRHHPHHRFDHRGFHHRHRHLYRHPAYRHRLPYRSFSPYYGQPWNRRGSGFGIGISPYGFSLHLGR